MQNIFRNFTLYLINSQFIIVQNHTRCAHSSALLMNSIQTLNGGDLEKAQRIWRLNSVLSATFLNCLVSKKKKKNPKMAPLATHTFLSQPLPCGSESTKY